MSSASPLRELSRATASRTLWRLAPDTINGV
jgi:hypothetical protein